MQMTQQYLTRCPADSGYCRRCACLASGDSPPAGLPLGYPGVPVWPQVSQHPLSCWAPLRVSRCACLATGVQPSLLSCWAALRVSRCACLASGVSPSPAGLPSGYPGVPVWPHIPFELLGWPQGLWPQVSHHPF